MIRRIDQVQVGGRRIFLRVDFNVPIANGQIAEFHRIESALPTLRLCLNQARQTIIASHLGRPDGKPNPKYSLTPVHAYLEKRLGAPVVLAPDCVGPDVENITRRPDSRIVLLENLRFHPEEEKNDPDFSRALASLADVYVNDAFGAAHRAHASIVGMAAFFKLRAAGFLMHKELDYLSRLLLRPDRPFVTILGGAKVSDKIGLIKNLLPKVDTLLIGGAMAYTFLKANGHSVGRSLLEEDKIPLAKDLMAQAAAHGVKLVLPRDHLTGNQEKTDPATSELDIAQERTGFDIGPATIKDFVQEIRGAKMVLWNGPMGLFEIEPFSQGSKAIAQALAENHGDLVSVVAGGDTVAAVTSAGVADKITHLSTGGGATLEFLEGRQLPGIKALEEGP